MSPGDQRRRVLFVCVENSCRSQMAEAFARSPTAAMLSKRPTAGSRPSGQVQPRTVQFLREKGLDLTQQWSKPLGELPPVEFDLIVGMGCGDEGCPRRERRPSWRRGAPGRGRL